MIKLLISLLILTGCTREPSQEEIDKAASKQLARKLSCALVSVNLDLTGEVQSRDYGYVCALYKRDQLGNPLVEFSDIEVNAIKKYISIKLQK